MLPTFKENLDDIRKKVTKIGDGLLESNKLLLEALGDCDSQKFSKAKGYIKNIGSKTDDIDNAIIKVLALYTPEAKDLRQVVAYLKITNELSRACSSSRSFIRGFVDVCSDVEVNIINEYAVPMQTSTVQAIKLTVSMINCEDEDEIQELYNEVLIEENKTDDLYEMVERNLSIQAKDINDFEKFHRMLRALRKSQKIASRSISIANLLVYAKIGGSIRS
ncbi:MAG: PhoU family transcriptional regulator [Epsilonproteobacteria bacterium]|nr:PhoU family transcriptional regulator [Campylobacterota bacterium]